MKFYGELLIFLILFITNARVFFLKSANRDPAVSLSVISPVLSILSIFAWGLDFFTFFAFFVSILVFLSNFHALYRYSERLYVDHYSPLMYFWAILTMLLSGAAIAALIFFRPLEIANTDIGVTETKNRFTGTFAGGFEKATSFQKASANIFTFEKTPPLENTEVDSTGDSADADKADKNIILFVPDKRSDTYYYKPYLQKLAASGFTVVSGDFFTSDCRWIHSFADAKIFRRLSLALKSILKNQWFMMQREYYTYNISLELKALDSFISETYGSDSQYFIICDVMGITACQDFIAKNNQKVSGFLALDGLESYKTPGYGFITETDPLMNAFLNKEITKKSDEIDEIFRITLGNPEVSTGSTDDLGNLEVTTGSTNNANNEGGKNDIK